MTDSLLRLIHEGLHRDGLEAIAQEAGTRVLAAPAVYGTLQLVAECLAEGQDDQGVPATQHHRIESLAMPMAALVEAQVNAGNPAAVLQALDRLMLAFTQLVG